MKKALLILLSVSYILTFAQNEKQKGLESITINSLKGPLEFLSSDWMEGRETGQKGAYMASDYLASLMKSMDLEPFRDGSYFQEFQLLDRKGSEQQLSIVQDQGRQEIVLEQKVDFNISSGNTSLLLKKDIVFAGYGIRNEDEKYDDYKNLDAKGKFVMILAGYPGHNDPDSEVAKKFKPQGYRAFRILMQEKINNAKKAGAAAIIFADPEFNVKKWAENTPFRYEKDYFEAEKRFPTYSDKELSLPAEGFEADPPIIRITAKLADFLIKDQSKSLESWEESCANNAKANSFVLDGTQLKLKYIVDNELINVRNVAGIIKGKDTTHCIVVGAHYDHYGMYNSYIWNGADDNGSGTIGVISVAKAFLRSGIMPEKNIVFVNFTGEEKGLLGSTYFARNFPADMEIDFMINLDMIGRDDEKRDSLGNQSAVIFHQDYINIKSLYSGLVDEQAINLDLLFWPSSGNGGSDHAPFAEKGAPFAFFWTGWHDDYHQPWDESDKINWPKMQNIVKLVYLSAWQMAVDGEDIRK